MPELAGRLLVANPKLADPNFSRAVVLVLANNDDGALGVVLNRPSDTSVAEALPGWEDVASVPAAVFVGGPVQTSTVIALAVSRIKEDVASLTAFDLDDGPEAAADKVAGLRMFAGYAGWGPGQLEDEIEEGGWFVVPADVGDGLTAEPDSLWKQVLRRQPGDLALVAAYPDDPEMN